MEIKEIVFIVLSFVIISLFCGLIYLCTKNNRIGQNFLSFFITLFIIYVFTYAVNTIFKIINSNIRLDYDVGDDVIKTPIYTIIPIVLYAMISLIQIVTLFIFYLKDGMMKNPNILFNFLLKTVSTIIILNLLLYLFKRGYYYTMLIISILPLLTMLFMLFYKASQFLN